MRTCKMHTDEGVVGDSDIVAVSDLVWMCYGIQQPLERVPLDTCSLSRMKLTNVTCALRTTVEEARANIK